MCPLDMPEKMAGSQDKSMAQNSATADKHPFDLSPDKKEPGQTESATGSSSAAPNNILSLTLANLKLSAENARLSYDNEAAIKAYTQALKLASENPGIIDMQTEYDLLAGREICSGLLGLYHEEQTDLDMMMQLAQDLNDIPRQIKAITSQVGLDNNLGNFTNAQLTAETGLELARAIGNRALEADCLTSLGTTFNSLSDYVNTQACHDAALLIYRELGNSKGEALSLNQMGSCLKDMGQSALSQDYIEQSYSIYRNLGDIDGQASCLNIMGILTKDKAEARSYYEQALAIYQVIGNRTFQANLNNNLGLVYWGLGLYGKAGEYLERAVQTVREIRGRSSLASFLESLGRIYLELENYGEAQQVLEEGRILSLEIGDRLSETTYLMMLGRVSQGTGNLEKARNLIQQACTMQQEMRTQGYLVTSLAWLGATQLALNDWDAAYHSTLEAITLLDIIGKVNEYLVQDVWWLHYQVLKTELIKKAKEVVSTLQPEDIQLDEPAWQCLQRAYEAMLSGIATLSDEGLRRNYLNKVKINRAILFEWTRVSAMRKNIDQPQPLPESRDEFASEPRRAREKLKRLLDISLQMNATLNPDTLPDFVIENVIELSGAERGFLLLVDETGKLDFKVARGIDQAEIEGVNSEKTRAILSKVIQTKAPVLLEEEIPDYMDSQDERLPWLNMRSAMGLPLLRRSGLIGIIYADNRSISGRFSQADVDLLSIFANQAATAIENARLFGERDRRITELSILDEIGRSLASTLNLDELLETVYHQVSRIFNVTNFYIAIYQEGDTEWMAAFQIEHGLRQPVVRHPLGLGLTGYILRTHLPVLLHSSLESKTFKEAQGIPLLGALARSWMGVPLLTADKIVGVMAIQSYEHENLYDDHALNLFSTIGSQVAIAVRNTRLYEEKSRANKELEAFSYSVSHDLRAPIRAINGFSHILMDEHAGQLDEEGKKYLNRVRDASQHMGELIDDMLRLSRVTRTEIRRTIVDLSQLARVVMGELQNTDPERNVKVAITPGLTVNADFNLMRILLENLLGNAWKFTRNHPWAKIELGVTEVDRQVTYFVRDDGAGFEMAYVNKLFVAFQRLHDASEFEGTGIGLATVQRIIHRHGGLVWAEGVVGHGATFYFTIPG